MWNLLAGEVVAHFCDGEPRRIEALAFSEDGTSLAVASASSQALLVDTRSWQVLRSLRMPMKCGQSISLPDGRKLATGDKSGNVSIWSVASGELLTAHRGHIGYVRSVRFTKDGRTLASGGDDQHIRLWDPIEGAEICTLEGHADKIYTLAFSPDDGLLASGSYDGAIRFWHAERGE